VRHDLSAEPKVLLYELNEVPWRVLDHYAERRPQSQTAQVLRRARLQTTVNSDPDPELQPWRTWPTLHKGLYTAEHNSLDLGQDPTTFRGRELWDVAEDAGLRVGVFGPLQSWPAREFRHGGFYIPDTFARTPQTYPASLSGFQAFNLAMTEDNGFSSDAPLSPKVMASAAVSVTTRGLTPRSAAVLARHLMRERRDARWKAARSMYQVVPAFDLYWRLHRRTDPHLSIFFTNHVAGMMHRFWGDSMEDYPEAHAYEPDELFGSFIFEAMDLFDSQLGRIRAHLRGHPGTLLMVASSMGQDAIPYHPVEHCYVLRDPLELVRELDLGIAAPGLTMYPRTTLEFADSEAAQSAQRVLQDVRAGDEPLFRDFRVRGTTLSFYISVEARSDEVTIAGRDEERTLPLSALGISRERRLGGANTAHHVPTGTLITEGEGISPDPSREEVDVRLVRSMILDHLGVPSELR